MGSHPLGSHPSGSLLSSFFPVQLPFEFGASGPDPVLFYSHKGLPQPGITTPTGDVIPTENPFYRFPAHGICPLLLSSPQRVVRETGSVRNYAWIAHTAPYSSGSNLEDEAHN